MRSSDWSSDVCSSDLVNRQIQTIATGIKQSIRQEYESARLQEGSLEAQVDRLKSATLSEQERSVRYNILAREADTNRTHYDGLLQRYQEVSAAAGITSSHVSVVAEAAVPTDPTFPARLLNPAPALRGALDGAVARGSGVTFG